MLAAASGDDTLGLDFGRSFVLGDSGPMGFAMMNAASLGTMWNFFMEMHELSVGLTSSLMIEEDDLMINLYAFSPLSRRVNILHDALLSIFIRHLRCHAGEGWYPVRMMMQRDEPADRGPWEEVFGPDLVFGQLVGRSYVRRTDLELCNPSADPRIFEIMSGVLRDALGQFRAESDIADRLRHAVECHLVMNKVDLRTLSKALGMSERSLQRRLAERGLSFEGVVKSVQRELVRVLLAQPAMRLEDVAERCGYGSLASFSRAVSGLYGTPPAALRKQLLAQHS